MVGGLFGQYKKKKAITRQKTLEYRRVSKPVFQSSFLEHCLALKSSITDGSKNIVFRDKYKATGIRPSLIDKDN